MMTTGKAARAAIYVRVSDPKQELKGSGLVTQEEACRVRAAENGYVLNESHVYRETFTGTELWKRPALTKLREAVDRCEVDVVIIQHTDRLSRDPEDRVYLFVEADRRGVAYESVTEVLEDSEEGKLVNYVRSYAASIERRQIIERTQRGMRNRVEGKKMLPPGPLPYGYQWRDETRGALDVDDLTAPIARRIFHDIIEGVSATRVAHELTLQGIPAPKGGKCWSTRTVTLIIRNPKYKGEAVAYRWRTEKGKRGQRMVERPADEQVLLPAGTIPPIVSPAEWDAAVARISGNKTGAIRNNRNPEAFLLRSGFVRCGYCGYSMFARSRSGHTPIYVCGRQQPGTRNCYGPGITASELDGAVWAQVSRVLSDPDFVRQDIERQLDDDTTEQELAQVERALANVEQQQRNLARKLAQVSDDGVAAPILAELGTLASRERALVAERETVKGRRAVYQETVARTDQMFKWYDLASDRIDRMAYAERRSWLANLGVGVKLWKKDHDPRYEIEMNIDPSFWEPPVEVEDYGSLVGPVWWFGGDKTYQWNERSVIVETTATATSPGSGPGRPGPAPPATSKSGRAWGSGGAAVPAPAWRRRRRRRPSNWGGARRAAAAVPDPATVGSGWPLASGARSVDRRRPDPDGPRVPRSDGRSDAA